MSKRKLLAALVACLLVGTLFVGPAAAVDSEPQDMPEDAEVGSDVQVTYEFTSLYGEFEQWTLHGETNLTNVTWTVRHYDQAGNQIRQASYDGQSFDEDVNIEDDTSRIEVRVTGTTPEIQNLSYDPPERFTLAKFTQVRSGGTEDEIADYQIHHYTQETKEARNAIDSASEAVEGSGSSEAQSSLDSAISAYEAGNFENAISLAERAEDEATQSQSVRTAVLAGAGVVVLLVLLGGGYYLYKSRQQAPSRLR
ncbi:MAG: hypothetical protein ACI8UR_001640 [Natronomonas sp.]|jgi:hypothetical protein|uniref:hypothetical protein n=1 Tax=Natronomonas sp. TaxID=2184060 RepID=UPI0039896FD8